MGQKINPIGLRLGINRGWDSTWFAKKKDFGRYLIEDFKIRKYIKKNIINFLSNLVRYGILSKLLYFQQKTRGYLIALKFNAFIIFATKKHA